MRKPPFGASLLLLLLPLAGCAHQSAGYAPVYAGYDDCEFDSDCYGFDRTAYSCVFVENPAAPARLAVVVSPQHHTPRVVIRGDWMPADSSGSASSSAGTPPQVIVAPAPVPREPVILSSPSAEGRTPRAPN